jgi:CRISPR-associated endonuclease/helicase Cas3
MGPLSRIAELITAVPADRKSEMRSITDFWGKARPAEGYGPGSHSIVYHSLDVAAVGKELIERDRERLNRIATAVGIDATALKSALPFFLSLHDIGKYSRVFQAKSPDHWPAAWLGPELERIPGNSHVTAGFQLLVAMSEDGISQDIFDTFLPDWTVNDRKILFRALAGHHGKPPDEPAQATSSLRSHDVSDSCLEAAHTHVRSMFELMRPEPLRHRSSRDLTILAVGVSGLFVLADWIGSAENWFPYTAPIEGDDSFDAYWRHACKAARRAVDEASVSPAEVERFDGMARLFPDIRSPSALQSFAERTPLPNGPSLIIIEDVTGAGKTEAALTLAHRLMAAGRATGLYVALPTEATANAMYARLGASFRRLFTCSATPSLVLAHGRRALHEGFQDSVVTAAARSHTQYGAPERDVDVRPSTAECAEWIADDRRKAFLADVGAGTIDQALLAILPVKHQSLRLWGLADRVLIVDEAHAYDAYMMRELETLLEFHSALGGSAIILSATLPKATRQRFAKAFRLGTSRARTTVAEQQVTDYPLVTVVASDTFVEAPQQIRHGLTRFVRATREGDLAGALSRVVAAAEAGARVAFVRNSVDEAISACEHLRIAGLDPLLFHARFAVFDRQRIEAEVMRTFGRDRDSHPRTRLRQVVVATQVIEQSLDLDFDLMVTDLAPIDLMIQRAGRLWRHARDARPITGPELVVLSAEPVDTPDKDWVNRVLGRSARVYPDHAQLWRSARTLFGAGGIATPDGVRSLVEAVYDEEASMQAPPALLDRELRAQGQRSAATSIAQTNVLLLRPTSGRPHVGYSADAGSWDSDVRTPTRLLNDTIRIRLGRFVDGSVLPWAEADELWRAWALSEVPVRVGRIAGEDESDSALARAVAIAKLRWPEIERAVPLVALRNDGEVWRGRALDSRASVPLIYDAGQGLRFC